jgi:hypothetical protein
VADPPPEPTPWSPLEPAPVPPPPTGYGPPSGHAPPPGYGPPPGWAPPPPLPKAGSARTGPLPLHPMGVGDILDGAFKLLRANARTAVLITGALLVPTAFITAYLGRDVLGGQSIFSVIDDPSAVEESSAGAGEILLLYGTVLARYVLFPFFIGAALSPVVEASYLGGERTAGEALRIAARVLPALIAAWLLTRLLWTFGVVFCVLPAFVVSTFFVVVAPALVIERLGAVAAMRRSVRLVRPMFWRILLISLLAGVIGYFVDNALGTLPQLAAVVIGTERAWPLLAVGEIVGSLITLPFVAIVAILLYYDGRIRHEGFDLQLMAADLARGGSAT